MGKLKYGGGGDWYSNPSSLPNLLQRLRQEFGNEICKDPQEIEILDPKLFEIPILYMTGHGEVKFSPQERILLRNYLLNGGFLWAEDNYGLDTSFRREMKSLFPHLTLEVVKNNHALFQGPYVFSSGAPKIHEHDGKPATFYQVKYAGKSLILYGYQMDLGDGWEDPEVHDVPPQLREKAFQMGVNVMNWYLNGRP